MQLGYGLEADSGRQSQPQRPQAGKAGHKYVAGRRRRGGEQCMAFSGSSGPRHMLSGAAAWHLTEGRGKGGE